MSREMVISCDLCKKRAIGVSVPTDRYTDAAGSGATRAQESDLCHEHAVAMLQDAMRMLHLNFRTGRGSAEGSEVIRLFATYKFKEMD